MRNDGMSKMKFAFAGKAKNIKNKVLNCSCNVYFNQR